MSNLGKEVLTAAQYYIGSPFRNHYEPVDRCGRGVSTDNTCMERGLDPNEGFDCSGLVVTAFCKVLAISIEKWPADLRHVRQLGWLSIAASPQPGDVVLFNLDDLYTAHASLFVDDQRIFHSSRKAGMVLTENYLSNLQDNRVVPAESIVRLIAELP